MRDVVRRPVFSARAAVPEARAREALALGTLTEGYVPGKGSNNWAVAGARSATGAPILAGDMHLSLSLPAIWYEAHLVAPGLNVYGVTIPGAPLPVQAFNDRIGWTFTNTGSDQIDHLALQLNEDSSAYLHNGQYRPFEVVPDTIFVKGTPPAIGALHYAHWGPADLDAEPPTALRWVAHEPSHTLTALWHMNHASSYEAFQEAIRFWDTPMQNILYADADGNIAIRSTGLAPLRRTPDGTGLLDGSTDAHEWVGRIPFDELPHSYNPGQGYLASTNQQPADTTYPYYLGRDWAPGYRSLRIDALLGSKDRHTLQDLKAYQGDVYVVQRDLFAPLLDSVGGLSPRANELRNLLNRWSGDATIDRPEPLVLDLYLDELERQVWDEPVFQRYERPDQTALYALIVEAPDSKWFDRANTPATEHAPDIMRTALETVADTLEARYGWERARWRWGDHHTVLFRHFTRSEALRPLWRGPYEYPGFASTLSPAADPVTTHSASWRVVVDFSTTPATGYGVYPGGQSGNPFSPLYDAHIETYLQFRHYPLDRPSTVDEIARDLVRAHVRLVPG